MSRQTWNQIKRYKLFYVNVYRRMGTVLLVIFSLNLILSLCMIKAYFNQPERRYYSTDGVKPPEQLVAMDDANMTSNAMLADDPINEDVVKTVPE